MSEDRIIEAMTTSQKVDQLVDQIAALQVEISNKVGALSLMTLISAEDFQRHPHAIEMIGGERALKIAVWNLYDRIMRDPELAAYFAGVNVQRVKEKQLQMFLALLGVSDYEGPALREVHSKHQITAAAFDRLMKIVRQILEDAGVPDDLQDDLISSLRMFKTDIVEEPHA